MFRRVPQAKTKQPPKKSREEIAYEILRVVRPLAIGVQQTLERRPGRKNPSSARRAVLDLLRQFGKPGSAAFLARVLLLDRQSVQRVVDQLLRAKYLKREPDPDDKRAPFILLTARGRAVLDKIREEEMRELLPMIKPFTHKELDVCSRVLEHLRIEFVIRATPDPRSHNAAKSIRTRASQP